MVTHKNETLCIKGFNILLDKPITARKNVVLDITKRNLAKPL